jgi:hypothetical protein
VEARVTRTARWLTAGAIALLALGLAVGLSLAYGGSDSATQTSTRPATVSAEELQSLFEEAKAGQKESDVLAKFPAPYEHYKDNLGEDCYEWKGATLYNICFRHGVVHLKTTF